MAKAEADSNDVHNEDENSDIENDMTKKLEYVNELRALVTEEKNLRVRMDDGFMLRYLRALNFDVKESFEKMIKVYKYKSKHKEYFCSGSISEYRDLLSKSHVTLLEDRDQSGCRIFLTKLGDIDTEHEDIVENIRLNDLWLELAMDEEETQKSGIHFIMDMGGFPMRLLKFFLSKHTIMSAMKEEMRPWKTFNIHVVNTSNMIDKMVAFVYPVLGSKIKKHIHFHGQDWASLHKFIDPKVLPTEYGGQKSVVDYDKMRQYVLDNEEKLMELLSLEYKKSS